MSVFSDSELLAVKPPKLWVAVAPIIFTIVLLFVQLFLYQNKSPHIPLIFGILITGLSGYFRGYRWHQMELGLYHVIHVGLPSIAILMIVGMLIGSWIACGTVPYLIYLGLLMLHPTWFLPASLLICALMSLATGTAWGTCGTVGLALVGIGSTMGIPLPLVAGAVVSGAFFGDKISPLSDTTNMAPAICGTKLFRHIRNMIPTTLPSMLIALLIYSIIGMKFQGSELNSENISMISDELNRQFNLSWLLLIPPGVVLILSLKGQPALPSLFIGVIAGIAMALVTQGQHLQNLFVIMQTGYTSNTGLPAIDTLLTKGGMQSMMWAASLMLIALGFGGVLERTRCLEVIILSILGIVESRAKLVLASLLTTFGVNVASGDPYIAMAIPGRMFAPAFRGLGLSTTNISRCVEDAGTLVSPLIPWNIGGVIVASTLGVPTIDYAFFAFACWLSPLIGAIYGLTGWKIPIATDIERQEWLEDEDLVLSNGEFHVYSEKLAPK